MDVNGINVDPYSSPAVGDLSRNTNVQTPSQIAGDYSSAMSQGKGLLNSSDNFDKGLGYGNHAETQAIKNRYMPEYGLQESKLNYENVRNAETDKLQHLQVVTGLAGQEVQLNKQKALLKWQVEQQNKKARGAVLGNVLGIVGGVVGAIYGNAPGAAAGFAAGEGAGQAIGSS